MDIIFVVSLYVSSKYSSTNPITMKILA